MELRAGVKVDRYTLVACLGEGGQAAVWKVIDPLEGGAVRALKVFQLRGASPENADRARREAKAVAGCRYPGLLPCRTLIEDPEHELVALVFDYARGRSLADAISDPRMTASLRWAALRQVAEALAYVHGRNVVHRDVKPDNVLVTDAFWGAPDEAGTLKLVDFGIAAPAGNPKPLTREGGVVGTAPYLAPELADSNGLFEAGNDFQRDVFAFGVMAWEVLVGGHPTGLPIGASRDAFAGIYLSARAGKRAWPPDAPGSAGLKIVRDCLSLRASERPDSCIAVANVLKMGSLDTIRPRTSELVIRGREDARTSATEIHVPPPGLTAGEARARSAPTSLRGVASPYAGQAHAPMPPPAPGRRPSVFWAAVAGAVAAAALVLGIVYFVSASASTSTPELQAPVVFSNAPVAPVPAPDPSTAKAQVACCPKDSDICRSGRACQPQPCGTLGEATWRLRVAGGTVDSGTNTVNIQKDWRSSSICLRNTRTGDVECARSNEIYTKGSDSMNRLKVKTSDLTMGNLEAWVIDGGMVRVSRTHVAGYAEGLRTSALCSNLILHLGQIKPDQGQIFVFLDDP